MGYTDSIKIRISNEPEQQDDQAGRSQLVGYQDLENDC